MPPHTKYLDIRNRIEAAILAGAFPDCRVALFMGYSFYATHSLKGTTAWDVLPPQLDPTGFPRVEVIP